MKIEEAIQVIDQALGSLQANREIHATLIRAMEVIREAVKVDKKK